jgi:hypothetical protein
MEQGTSLEEFYGTENSFPFSQEPAIGPYPEPVESSPHSPILLV